MPCIPRYKTTRMKYTDRVINMDENNLNIGSIVRKAAIWNRQKNFIGFTATMYLNQISHNPMNIYDIYFRTRIYCGFRF